MTRVMECIVAMPLVVIIRLPDLRYASSLVRSLLDADITALEFSLTNPNAVTAIQALRTEIRDFEAGTAVIGAGTVTNTDELKAVLDAGAQFIVSPVVDADVIRLSKAAGVPIMAGAYTPTEILNAWRLGADIVKVFPARALGPAYIRDVLSPMPYLRLMPTGGVDLNNIGDYLASGVVALGIGSNLVSEQLVADQDWETIKQRAQQYVQAVRASTPK